MSAKFSRDLQKMTIELIHQLAAVVDMPAVGVRISRENKAKPIIIYEKARPEHCNDLSISSFLSIDIQMAIADGGTRAALMGATGIRRSSVLAWDMEPLETDTIEQTVAALGLTKGIAAKE